MAITGFSSGRTAVTVWVGRTKEVESHTGTNYFVGTQYIDDRWLIDKEGIAVSQQANTAGTVYVVYLRSAINNNPAFPSQSIGFAMLDDATPPAGQWKIRTDVPRPPSGIVQSPIVVVDQVYGGAPGGNVYVIYLDWTNH